MRLVSSDTMRALDRKAMAGYGVKGLVLMENAGRGVADIVEREFFAEGRAGGWKGGHRVAIIAGKGSNGGDGFVCARHLKNRGYDVSVVLLASPGALRGDARANAAAWKKAGGRVLTALSPAALKRHGGLLAHSSVIVDAVLGTGITAPVKGVYRAAIELVNRLGKPVVAVDVPSGLCATTGRVMGGAVRASVTATMGFAKTGLFLYPGRDFAGRVEVVDIGMPAALTDAVKTKTSLIDRPMVAACFSPRARDTHKGTYGHVLIVGGSAGKTGAACMAGMGALRAGAGLATIAAPKGVNSIIEAKTMEVMTHPLTETEGGRLGACSLEDTVRALDGKAALVMGPGLGPVEAAYMEKTLAACAGLGMPVVLDADGLNAVAGMVALLKKISKKTGVVLTPHPGELARLLDTSTKAVQDDRVSAAAKLARKTGCTVVLKGAATLVVSPEGLFINPTGNPGMATAGTGDVLSGMIGGFLAQGLAVKDAAVAAVYIHGLSGDRAAERLGEAGLVATDILTEVPGVIDSFVNG